MNIFSKDKLIKDFIPLILYAGDEVMHYFKNKQFNSTIKKDGSIVTDADKIVDKIICDGINKILPEVTIISEENEFNHSSNPGDIFFLVDSIDGTKEFVKEDSTGNFTVNIALIENGYPTLGMIFAPFFNELFYGIKGVGAFKNYKKIFTREISNKDPLILSSKSSFNLEVEKSLKKRGIIRKEFLTSSLKFCKIASGDADFYLRFGTTMEWDIAAGHAILLCAGGEILNLNGEKIKYGKKSFKNDSFIALGKKKNFNHFFCDF